MSCFVLKHTAIKAVCFSFCAKLPITDASLALECGKRKKVLRLSIVKTGDVLERSKKAYEVLIADDNIFVIGEIRHDPEEGCKVVSYENPEIYANQSEINTLSELGFTKIDRG